MGFGCKGVGGTGQVGWVLGARGTCMTGHVLASGHAPAGLLDFWAFGAQGG